MNIRRLIASAILAVLGAPALAASAPAQPMPPTPIVAPSTSSMAGGGVSVHRVGGGIVVFRRTPGGGTSSRFYPNTHMVLL